MFDISFSELMLIGVVALVVVGPEKLPKVARTAGLFIGKLQRYLSQVKEEINRDLRFEELQKLQAEIATGAQSLRDDLQIDHFNSANPILDNPDEAEVNANRKNAMKRKLKKAAYTQRNHFSKTVPKKTLKTHLQKSPR